jgi:hypothetical protein
VDIERIPVPGKLGIKVRDPISSNKRWAWWYMPAFPAMRNINRKISIQTYLRINARPY